MEEKDVILAFDQLYTTNHIQILKLAYEKLSDDKKPYLAVVIKYLEFKYTFSLLSDLKRCSLICNLSDIIKDFSPGQLSKEKLSEIFSFLEKIKPYCNESESALLLKILNIKKSMDSMDQIMPMLKLMNSFQDENDSLNILNEYLSAEQQALFQAFMSE